MFELSNTVCKIFRATELLWVQQYSHLSHLNGCLLLLVSVCLARELLWVQQYSHSSRLNGRSQLWKSSGTRRLSHLNRHSPLLKGSRARTHHTRKAVRRHGRSWFESLTVEKSAKITDHDSRNGVVRWQMSKSINFILLQFVFSSNGQPLGYSRNLADLPKDSVLHN